MVRFCHMCGNRIASEDSLFCTNCGTKLPTLLPIQQPADNQNIRIHQPMIANNQPICKVTQQNNEKISGEIAYYGLQEWWIKELTAEERNTIISTYKPLVLGVSDYSLVEGTVTHSNRTAIAFLTGLSTWFQNKEHRKIGIKIIKKIESMINLSSENTPILDKHFSIMMAIKRYYRDRDIDEFSLSAAIESCHQQIAISGLAKKAFLKEYKGSPLPSHTGYTQLCIILEKQQKFDEVIRLATIAKEQGWNGDWDKRIERCSKKK